MRKGSGQSPGDVVGNVVAADGDGREVNRMSVFETGNAGGAAADVDDGGADFLFVFDQAGKS